MPPPKSHQPLTEIQDHGGRDRVETDSLTASTQVFATLQRRTIEEWPFCEQNNTLLGFTALFTHHNYPPHFEEVGENSFGVGFA